MQTSGYKQLCYSIGHRSTWPFVLWYLVVRHIIRNVYVQGEKYSLPVTALEMATL